MINKAQWLRHIKAAFDRLNWAFDAETVNHAQALLDLCCDEEKAHRKMGHFNAYHPNAPGVTDCARLFAVKCVAEYLLKPVYPSGQQYLHMQKSCFIAAGVADEFGDKVRAAWKDFDLSTLAALDYCDYVKAQNPEKVAA
jgi:hypothetical protein